MKKITLLTFAAIFAMASIGCTTATNTTTNTKMTNANSNTAMVVNNNSMAVNSTSSTTTTTTNSNRYSSTMTREEYDKNQASYETERTGSKIGTGAEDSWLWFKTKAALTAVDELRDSTINVDVENSVVTLRGTVASKAEADKAIAAAKGVKDVKDVKSVLTVKPGDSMTNQMTGGSSDSDTKTKTTTTTTNSTPMKK